MKVFMLRADSDHYQGVIMPDDDLFEFSRRFNGRPMKYTRMDERICVDPDHLTFPKGDYPSLYRLPKFLSFFFSTRMTGDCSTQATRKSPDFTTLPQKTSSQAIRHYFWHLL
jgi:hypothetical protein